MRSPALLLLLGVTLAGCVTPRAGDMSRAEQDPWEKTNRRIYAVNKGIDKYGLKPAADVYRTVVPQSARTGVANAFSNYGEPSNMLNAVLQGKIKQAFRTVDRFLINSVLGIGGIADNATALGRPQEPEDFDQTFATWGIKSGPYLMLPFFGPSTLRGAFGLGTDFLTDPADIARNAISSPSFFWRAGQLAGRIVNLRARVSDQGGDALLADSLDEYTLVNSAYLQRQRSLIWDGNPPLDDEELPPDDSTGSAGNDSEATTSPAVLPPPAVAEPPR